MGIGRPGSDPEASLGVPSHLDWLGQIGKLFFGSEQVHFQTGGKLHVFNGLNRIKKNVLAIWTRAGFVGFNRNQRRGIGIINCEFLVLRDGPNPLIAIGGHHIENLHLALQNVPILHIIHELELDRPPYTL